MRKWNNREIEQSLSRAALSGKTDVYGRLANAPAARQSRALALIPDSAPVPRRRAPVRALAACACLFILCGVGLWSWFGTAASITIEINPSFLLTANRFGRVLSIAPQNEEAEAVLDGLTLRYAKLDDALAALSDSLLRHDYLTPTSTVRVTVTGPSEAQAEQLAQRVTQDIRALQPQAKPEEKAEEKPEAPPESAPAPAAPNQAATAPSAAPSTAPAPKPSGAGASPAPPRGDHFDDDERDDDDDDDEDDDREDEDLSDERDQNDMPALQPTPAPPAGQPDASQNDERDEEYFDREDDGDDDDDRDDDGDDEHDDDSDDEHDDDEHDDDD